VPRGDVEGRFVGGGAQIVAFAFREYPSVRADFTYLPVSKYFWIEKRYCFAVTRHNFLSSRLVSASNGAIGK
jgi:hypothetical protein